MAYYRAGEKGRGRRRRRRRRKEGRRGRRRRKHQVGLQHLVGRNSQVMIKEGTYPFCIYSNTAGWG